MSPFPVFWFVEFLVDSLKSADWPRTVRWQDLLLPGQTLCVCLGLLQREEFHTRLALLYLDQVLQLRPLEGSPDGSPGAEVPEVQKKLRLLLQRSDLYRVHYLLGEGALQGEELGRREGLRTRLCPWERTTVAWSGACSFLEKLSAMAQHDAYLKLRSLCEFVCVCMDS